MCIRQICKLRQLRQLQTLFPRPAEIMIAPGKLEIPPGKAPGIPCKIELGKQWPPCFPKKNTLF